jgi:secreted Zn-dependent insulinase-like peptidase
MLNVAHEKKVLRKYLDQLSFEDFIKTYEDWFKSGRLLFFVHGNISKESSIEIVERARKTFNL